MNNGMNPNTLPERSENFYFDKDILKGASILLVEDNKINQDVAKTMLDQRGMLVDVAENGRQAVEKVRKNLFNCVLMDLQMPIMDGHTATRIIRQEMQNRRLPILALTAKVLEADIKKALDAGMNCHIPKPINLDFLLNEMAYWITYSKKQQTDPMRDSLKKVGGNKDLFLKILNVFLEKHISDYDTVVSLLEDGNTEEARKIVHTLKGVAPVVGAEKLYQLTIDLEASLLHDSSSNRPDLLDDFNTYLQEAGSTVRNYIADN